MDVIMPGSRACYRPPWNNRVEKLGLGYQTTLLATRDANSSMRLTCAIEVWLPSIGVYKEVSSASWSGGYQARRAGIRYRPGQGKPAACIRTPNAAVLAADRLLPAIAGQHHQQPGGTVVVPGPLRAWTGTDVLRPGAKPFIQNGRLLRVPGQVPPCPRRDGHRRAGMMPPAVGGRS
jgi:hypothetical protein